MEKSEIVEKIKDMQTVSDLSSLLDLIKQDEFGSVKYGISENMLKLFSSDSIVRKRFRSFKIRK